MAGKDVDEGDKIFLPPSALDRLARMNVEYPMLFEITNTMIGKKTNCGVLEFSAEEGWCYMPFGMMQNLAVSEHLTSMSPSLPLICSGQHIQVDEGSLVSVKNVSLAKATFVKFRAQSVDFLEVSNPRALLEVSLRKFTCLTVGDTICIPYSGKRFYLDVREVQPNGAASIIETDCNVDFEEPLGYKDSKYAKYEQEAKEKQEKRAAEGASGGAANSVGGGVVRPVQKARAEPTDAEKAAEAAFKPFTGSAKRIDGKLTAAAQEAKAAGLPPPSGTTTNSSAGGSAGSSMKAESKEDIVVPTFQSRIGDKYSKKKVAASAFTGTAYKLS
jgi:ubiquitin fusion degradation protein 1